MSDIYWTRALSKRLNRRRALITGGGATAAAAILAACGSSGGSGSNKEAEIKKLIDKSGLIVQPADTTAQARRGGRVSKSTSRLSSIVLRKSASIPRTAR